MSPVTPHAGPQELLLTSSSVTDVISCTLEKPWADGWFSFLLRAIKPSECRISLFPGFISCLPVEKGVQDMWNLPEFKQTMTVAQWIIYIWRTVKSLTRAFFLTEGISQDQLEPTLTNFPYPRWWDASLFYIVMPYMSEPRSNSSD